MQEGQADQHHRNRIDLGITHMRFVHAVSAIKQGGFKQQVQQYKNQP